ncbi:MAG: hypothetical protein GKR94_32330 [Gammaproteobacteria bacterium]|nr:hypothetical protein [Gammaproteobacteria bacterium]
MIDEVCAAVGRVAAQFATECDERLYRRTLVPEDFSVLADAGLLRLGLPVERGGCWLGAAASVRMYARVFRALAAGDPSIALVTAMHPAVLSFWLESHEVAPERAAALAAQRARVFDDVAGGHWFGTVASEPGSAGNLMETKAVARPSPDGDGWELSGHKHMGSGSGITSFMITVAKPEGEADAELFLLDTRGHPWDGSSGMRLLAEWDGHGMAATQSHAFMFDGMPALRFANPGNITTIAPKVLPYISSTFAAVTMGVLDAAMGAAQQTIGPKARGLKPYERVEWSKAQNHYWLAGQALGGMVGAVEADEDAGLTALHGKIAIAELAQSTMESVARAIGGRSFSRSLPFGQWALDVKALGYLRPPWALAYDQMYEAFELSVP